MIKATMKSVVMLEIATGVTPTCLIIHHVLEDGAPTPYTDIDLLLLLLLQKNCCINRWGS